MPTRAAAPRVRHGLGRDERRCVPRLSCRGLGASSAFSRDGAVHFVCMDWRHMDDLATVGRRIYGDLLNLCVWNKSNAGMGSLYRSKHEMVFVYKVGSAPHRNAVELGRHGRNRTNVWDYPSVNSLRGSRREDLALHPTVKRWRWWRMRSRMSPRAASGCSTSSSARARPCWPPSARAGSAAASRSTRLCRCGLPSPVGRR